MIITDPFKKPSERFIEVIKEYFTSKEFTYKKNENQFSRKNGNRKEMVGVFYNKTVNLVRATLSWSILFPDLEEIYNKIQVSEKNFREVTIWTNLLNYLPLRNSKVDSEFVLYNAEHTYDDISLNNAAKELISSYEKYIEPFFEHYKELKTLEGELNKAPIHHHPYIGYGGRHIAFGLILGKFLNKENFNYLKEVYHEYILNDKEDASFKKEMEKIYESTISYLDSADSFKLTN